MDLGETIEIEVHTLEVAANDLKHTALKGVKVEDFEYENNEHPYDEGIELLLISFSTNISGKMVASWLYDKLKDTDAVMIINGDDVEITEQQIKQAIENEVKRLGSRRK